MVGKKIVALFLFLLPLYTSAQPGGGPPPDPGQPVPISGIEILIGAGALLGAKRLSKLRNKKT